MCVLAAARLDNGNALYVGLPLYLIWKLQPVQSSAARLVWEETERPFYAQALKHSTDLSVWFWPKPKVLIIALKAFKPLERMSLFYELFTFAVIIWGGSPIVAMRISGNRSALGLLCCYRSSFEYTPTHIEGPNIFIFFIFFKKMVIVTSNHFMYFTCFY